MTHTRGGQNWTLITPETCSLLHAVLQSSAIKPAEGNLLVAQINGEIDVWRLETIMRHGLASLIDDTFIPFGDSFTDDEIVIEGVVTFIIYDAKNDVFDDSPCM